MAFSDWLPWGDIPEISARSLAENLPNVQVLDVRTPREFRRNHVFGAINVPITRLDPQNVLTLGLDAGRPVVVICLTAHRSIPAVKKLRRWGFDAEQLQGGMRAWWQQELPCASSEQ
ncbi:rhodanese-like domain-containing protein [Marinobacteraceae bacterium S3BR75-40.1]